MKVDGNDSLRRVDRGAPAPSNVETRRDPDSHIDSAERVRATGSTQRSLAASSGRTLSERIQEAMGSSAVGGSSGIATPEQAIELLRYVSDEVLPGLGEQDDVTRLSAAMLSEEIEKHEDIISRLGRATPESSIEPGVHGASRVGA